MKHLKKLNELMSTIPAENKKDSDKQILRTAIIAELDAINLYEQMAFVTKNKKLKETLLDIAKEEKTHIGEFQTLLLELDDEFDDELEKGEDEVKEKTKK